MSLARLALLLVLVSTACAKEAGTDPGPCPPDAYCSQLTYVPECGQALKCSPGDCEPYAPLAASATEYAHETWAEGVCGDYWVRQYVAYGEETHMLVWDARTKAFVGRRTRSAFASFECADAGTSDVLIEGIVPDDCTVFGVSLERDGGAADAGAADGG
jgi:hypothetical protein